MRLDDDLCSPIQQRWRKQTSGTRVAAARRRAYSGDIPNPVQTPNKGNPLIGGRNKEREIYIIYLYFSRIFCVKKRLPTTSIYRGYRGVHACQLAMWY